MPILKKLGVAYLQVPNFYAKKLWVKFAFDQHVVDTSQQSLTKNPAENQIDSGAVNPNQAT